MTLNHNIEKLEVFYDGSCPLCCQFSEWLQKQKIRQQSKQETSAKLQNNKVLDEIECDEKTVEAQCIKDTRELRKFRISSILLKVEDLQRSQQSIELVCHPYQSEQAQALFPNIADYEPDKLLVARINQDQVVIGEQAWIYCLYICQNYEPLATKMSQEPWLKLAKKTALSVANNRYSISKLLKLKKPPRFEREEG